MGKNVLIISTTLRKGGNSEILASSFADGAKNAGHNVEMICLHGKSIEFCIGCFACQKTKSCVIKDDTADIVQKMLTADVLVFATPVYFYEMSGQMKTLLDRTNPLFPCDYSFRDIYLLATAADEEESAMDGTVNGLQGWIDCFKDASLKGVIRAIGVTDISDIQDTPVLEKAYTMGQQV